MRRIIATVRGVSAYSQSKHHETPKLDRELHDAYEAHHGPDGLRYFYAGWKGA